MTYRYSRPFFVQLMPFFFGISCLGGDYENFEHGGEERRYILHKPENLAEDSPLIFVLHGYRGKAHQYQWFLKFDEIANREGFGVVYPQGSKDRYRKNHWNADLSLSEVDDVGFLSELAVYLQTEHGFDPTKTVTSGVSNGGFMSYKLACERPETFVAMASIIGTMSGTTWNNCNPQVAIPVLQISGVADEIVPIDGTMDLEDGWGGAPPADQVMEYWGEVNSCTAVDTTDLPEQATEIRYTECIDDNEVWYYKIHQMAHEVPQSKDQYGIDSGETLWSFFDHVAFQH